ncbi:MAG: DUF58 domain-containing protein [Oscillospiraceae bacterium]|jgi:uncharacterized protein (DUF58 family)|nr:DUF58 domain-containing protein [Oscillospiraceae bacterium]
MLLTTTTLAKLDAFALALRERTQGGTGGLRRAKTLGSSVEFSDFRSYAPGDDLRRVDWNAYARFDKLFLKLFLDEQETTLRLLLDASRSMDFGEPNKWHLARQVAAMLAYLALSRYDRVVVAVLRGAEVAVSRTFGGRAAYPEVEGFLEGIVPQGETRLDAALPRLPISAGRGVCVLISDLLTEAGWMRGVASLRYRRQEVSLLQILSPEELSPQYSGALQLLDAEGAPPCEVTATPDVLKRYHDALNALIAEARDFCRARALPYRLLQSDLSLEDSVLGELVAAGLVAAR